MSDLIPPNRIRELRKSKKLTLQQLADAVVSRGRIPMQQATLTRIETRQKRISDEQLVEIAAVLEVEPADLMKSEPEAEVRLVPLVPWRDRLDILIDLPKSGPIAVATSSPKVVAVRIPKGVDLLVHYDGARPIIIVDLADRDARDGWWIGKVGSDVTLLKREGGVWTDAMHVDELRVREGAVKLIGRIIEYRVPTEEEPDDDVVGDDVYVEFNADAADIEHDDKKHNPKFVEKATSK